MKNPISQEEHELLDIAKQHGQQWLTENLDKEQVKILLGRIDGKSLAEICRETGIEFFPQGREQNFGADISTVIGKIETICKKCRKTKSHRTVGKMGIA